ncbi:uncharacterized protein NPIL_224691 [Nephila pilipes]|uniref:Uncharacterized protein n=1 Tax=Nephila pilipes TaxID=299642 RepID=A0A8X6UQV4_NEPPI|nr:uncharacterized protein NPIL_224691 [Nephila pilipes]
MCFKLDDEGKQLVNGQRNPLSQTLENFIALAEKFEAANTNIGLKGELFYFLRSFIYDNIEYNSLGDIVRWEPKETKLEDFKTLWEPDENERRRIPDGTDPFTEEEKCSLFFMLSHSIIRTPRNTNGQRMMILNNYTRSFGRYFSLDDQYPMEIGVVSIRGTNLAVSLGRVLRGLYVGLREQRKRDISDFPRIPEKEYPPQRILDPLYTLTIAEVITLSTWRPEVGNREKLAMDGFWVSAPIGSDLETKDVCPMIYRLRNGTTSAHSSSSLRGAADGLILGKIIHSMYMENRNLKLSQILRMYYSRGGILEKTEDIGPIWASFCNRENNLLPLEQTLKEQMILYHLLVTNSYKNLEESMNYAWKNYQDMKSSSFRIYNQVLSDYCTKELNIEKPENLPKETPLDVIAILDTTNEEEYLKRQQLILGFFAKELDLRYSGSRMTILTDEKMPSSSASASGTVLLRPIITDTYSSACTACSVTQISGDDTYASAPEDEVILAIDQYLQAKKDNETQHSGVNGKVVIYFNFEGEDYQTRPTSQRARLEQNLRNLHIRHKDVAIYALGRSTELVKKYARGDEAFVMSAVDETENKVASNLLDKILTAPATLQYTNCDTGKDEKSAVHEDFVTPNAVQHWSMPAKYFYKSRTLKITFESVSGPIRVCHNRATESPELERINCADVATGQKKVLG